MGRPLAAFAVAALLLAASPPAALAAPAGPLDPGTASAPTTPAAALRLAQAQGTGSAAGPASVPAAEPAQPATTPAVTEAAAPVGTEPAWRHATALTGTPRYPAGFAHFDYVNPDAPKGGTVRLATAAPFNSFNPLRIGDNPAAGLNLVFQQLMAPAEDEQDISGQYGLVAEAIRFPDDVAWAEFRLDPAARWHDGSPITAADVVFSFDAARKVDVNQRTYYRDVTAAEALDERTVRFTFARPGNRELPHILAQLTVLSKAWWEGTGPNGPRSIERGTLEPPLGSGPYRIADFAAGRFVSYARVPDAWAASHPTQLGANNFDTIRYEVYRDATIAVEALKGDRIDFRAENSARSWAFAYDTPALSRGDLIKETFPLEAVGLMQAFVMNLRREKFADERVRRALNLMYDFEAQKSTIFYDQYHRIASYFEGTALASSGLPQGREREILEEVRALVPASVFTEPYANPTGGSAAAARDNARQAVALFREAGWEIRGGRMVNIATGAPFTIDFIADQPSVERYVLPYAQDLKRIGVALTLRVVDASQYEQIIRDRGFDMVVDAWGQSLSPGNEQAYFWGSAAADEPTSRNTAGIKDKGVDALIERVIVARDRDELVAATKALDRVLLHHDFMVPLFSVGYARTVRWNRFSHPDNIPPYTTGFPTIWWWDAAKAASVRGGA